MKIAVTSEGPTLDCRVDQRFGRCGYLMLVETSDMSFRTMANPYTDEHGGTGSRLAGLVTSSGAKLVLTGSLGSHARQALEAARIGVVLNNSGTVRQAVEVYVGRQLSPHNSDLLSDKTASSGQGLRRGHGAGYDEYGYYSFGSGNTPTASQRGLQPHRGLAAHTGPAAGIVCDIAHRPLRLRLYPDSVLRGVAEPVHEVDRHVANLAHDMLDLMHRSEGIGLAAPQVGLPLRVIVADIGEGRLGIVNPQVVPVTDATGRMNEGCLSLPDVTVEIDRKLKIEVRGIDPNGAPMHFEAGGLLARVIQHEVDHLQGVLICDYESTSSETTQDAAD